MLDLSASPFASPTRWLYLSAARIFYYGTNPLAFAAPGEGDDVMTFDMAHNGASQGGKVLDARSRNEPIPDTGCR